MARHSALWPSLPLLPLLLLLPTALSHMQLIDPSPLRDPHSNREPKDYNMLSPLKADGSDFTCKGYQWNTPLTPVATYHAGEQYNITLKGGATHGGGSCQISLSCDNGLHFKVLQSIVGECPLKNSYAFRIPESVESAICLLSWTWFNKVGNREMYMNCAVVNIVGATGSKKKFLDDRDSSASSAQARLSHLPDMFVANLKSINDCTTKETVDVNFDDPGRSVNYGDGMKPSASTGKKGACVGVGRKSGSGPLPANPADSAGAASGGSSGGSAGGNQNQNQGPGSGSGGWSTGSSGSNSCNLNDGQWHPNGCGESSQPSAQAAGKDMSGIGLSSDDMSSSKPKANVPQELYAYAGGSENVDSDTWSSSGAKEVVNAKSSPQKVKPGLDWSYDAGSKVNSAYSSSYDKYTEGTTSKNNDEDGWYYYYDNDSDAYGRQKYIPSQSDTPTNTPAPASAPQSLVLAEDTEASADCGAARLSYASNDLSQYLPCKPGAFLCKSPTEFYTCKQDGDGWNYGALRPVADGMECKPQLATTNELKRRHHVRRQAGPTPSPAKSNSKPTAAQPSKQGAGDGTDDEAVTAFFGPEPSNYEQEWPVSEQPASATPTPSATPAAKKPKAKPSKATPKKSSKKAPTKSTKKAKATPTPKKSTKKPKTTRAPKPTPKKSAAKSSPSTLERVFVRSPRALPAKHQEKKKAQEQDHQRAKEKPTPSPPAKKKQPLSPKKSKNKTPSSPDADEEDQQRPSYPAEPGDGTDDAAEALFPGLKEQDPTYEGLEDPNGGGGGDYFHPTPSSSSSSVKIFKHSLTPTTIGTAVSTSSPPPVFSYKALVPSISSTHSSPSSSSSPSSTSTPSPSPKDESQSNESNAQEWQDGVFFLPPPTPSPSSSSSSSPKSTTTNPAPSPPTKPPYPPTLSDELAASILPYFFGHGPVIPPGLSLSWPTPRIPAASTVATSVAAAKGTSDEWPPKLPGVTGVWPPKVPGVARRDVEGGPCVGRERGMMMMRDDVHVRVGERGV